MLKTLPHTTVLAAVAVLKTIKWQTEKKFKPRTNLNTRYILTKKDLTDNELINSDTVHTFLEDKKTKQNKTKNE